jgi:hypothetical protein
MAQMLNKFLGLALLTCMSVAQATSIIIPRSQSVNAARELVGWQQFINKADMDCLYGAFSLTAEYQQSFRGARLMQCLFDGDVFLNNSFTSTATTVSITNSGCCGSNNSCNSNNNCNSVASLLVQGSCVGSRNPNAWLADYFGLPTDFNSVVSFRPKIQNAIFDFNLYLGLGDLGCGGLFFRIHAPIVWTKWTLCASEAVIASGVQPYLSGYMNTYSGIPASSLATSFLSAINGTYTFGDMQTPLKHGIFCGNGSNFNNGSGSCCGNNNNGTNGSCNNGLVRLSDIEAAFGYNFVECEDYHFGLEIRGSAPTGNKPCNICLFEPIVGNGKFWTLGGGLTAHAVLWRDCECPDRTFSFYIDANVETLFKNCQSRSFDLTGRPNSRYMLVEQLGSPSTTVPLFAGTLGAATAVPFQYVPNSLQPLINVSTFNANVSYAAQGDVAMKFSYMTPNWDLDLGYEFWGRSKEKVCLRANSFPANTYALKGDAFIYGFGASNSPVGANQIVPLSATESNATIHSGTSAGISGLGCSTATTAAIIAFNQNSGIDNRTNATLSATTALTQVTYLPNQTAIAANAQFTSNPPVFLTAASFATCGGNSAYTNKIFANISYSWECDCISPFFGIGGEAEFSSCGRNNGNCGTGSGTSSCGTGSCGTSTSCNNDSCAISQWGVWLKGGVGF